MKNVIKLKTKPYVIDLYWDGETLHDVLYYIESFSERYVIMPDGVTVIKGKPEWVYFIKEMPHE